MEKFFEVLPALALTLVWVATVLKVSKDATELQNSTVARQRATNCYAFAAVISVGLTSALALMALPETSLPLIMGAWFAPMMVTIAVLIFLRRTARRHPDRPDPTVPIHGDLVEQTVSAVCPDLRHQSGVSVVHLDITLRADE